MSFSDRAECGAVSRLVIDEVRSPRAASLQPTLVVRVIARPFPPGDGSPSVNSVQAGSRCMGRRPCVGRRSAAASLLWDCACGVCVGVTQTFRALADKPGPTMSSTGGSVRLGGDGGVHAYVALSRAANWLQV